MRINKILICFFCILPFQNPYLVKVKDLTTFLEKWAPSVYQESYDNSKLIVGNPNTQITKCIVCLDCIEAVVDEAIAQKAQLIVAHHPIVFSGLKSLTGGNYIERVIIKAIKNDIAIYALHTNLDNVFNGVNHKIAERLGLKKLKVLQPKSGLVNKLVTYVPVAQSGAVLQAMFNAGGGKIGDYSECSFSTSGSGTFLAGANTKPFVGEKGTRHHEEETRVEIIVPQHLLNSVINAMKTAHPYEEVAYDVYSLVNKNQEIGSGMVGELEEPMSEKDFLTFVKENLNTQVIRHTQLLGKEIKKVAFCGGAGSFLLGKAISVRADVFITGDFKYHEFFDADGNLVILDVGHFESEQFTIDLIAEKLSDNFPTFAVLKTEVNTNPISYFK